MTERGLKEAETIVKHEQFEGQEQNSMEF